MRSKFNEHWFEILSSEWSRHFYTIIFKKERIKFPVRSSFYAYINLIKCLKYCKTQKYIRFYARFYCSRVCTIQHYGVNLAAHRSKIVKTKSTEMCAFKIVRIICKILLFVWVNINKPKVLSSSVEICTKWKLWWFRTM